MLTNRFSVVMYFKLALTNIVDWSGLFCNAAILTFCHLLIHDRYELMSDCWDEDPSSRPSFSELIDRLEVIMTRDVPYCDLDKHDESRSYYNMPINADGHSG